MRRDRIVPDELVSVSGGDPAGAPREVVGIIGSARLKHWRPAGRVVFSADGRRLISTDNPTSRAAENRAYVWDAQTGRLFATLPIGGDARAISPDGKVVHALADHGGLVEALTFSCDGRYLAGYDSGWLRVWDLKSPGKSWTMVGRGTQPTLDRVHPSAFTPDGKHLVAAGRFLNLFTGAEDFAIKNVVVLGGLAISPDGSTWQPPATNADWRFGTRPTATRCWARASPAMRYPVWPSARTAGTC